MQKIVPIKPKDLVEFRQLVKKIDGRASIIEIWLDAVADLDVFLMKFKFVGENICAQNKNTKFLAVCKRQNEKGQFKGTTQERVAILERFLAAGGDFIDLDITQNDLMDINQIDPQKLIISFHDFISTPQNLATIYKEMQKIAPAFYKLAVTTNTSADLENFLEFAQNKSNTIFTTMGKLGAQGRVKLAIDNCTWGAFYALDEGSKTASGQAIL